MRLSQFRFTGNAAPPGGGIVATWGGVTRAARHSKHST